MCVLNFYNARLVKHTLVKQDEPSFSTNTLKGIIFPLKITRHQVYPNPFGAQSLVYRQSAGFLGGGGGGIDALG